MNQIQHSRKVVCCSNFKIHPKEQSKKYRPLSRDDRSPYKPSAAHTRRAIPILRPCRSQFMGHRNICRVKISSFGFTLKFFLIARIHFENFEMHECKSKFWKFGIYIHASRIFYLPNFHKNCMHAARNFENLEYTSMQVGFLKICLIFTKNVPSVRVFVVWY